MAMGKIETCSRYGSQPVFIKGLIRPSHFCLIYQTPLHKLSPLLPLRLLTMSANEPDSECKSIWQHIAHRAGEAVEMAMRKYEYDQVDSQGGDPQQHPMSVAIRNALKDKYLACEPWARELARDVFPWFVNRLKETPDYELMFHMVEM